MGGINHKRYHKDGSVTHTTGTGGWYTTVTYTAEEWVENQKWKDIALASLALFVGAPILFLICWISKSIIPLVFVSPFLLVGAMFLVAQPPKETKGKMKEEQDNVQ